MIAPLWRFARLLYSYDAPCVKSQINSSHEGSRPFIWTKLILFIIFTIIANSKLRQLISNSVRYVVISSSVGKNKTRKLGIPWIRALPASRSHYTAVFLTDKHVLWRCLWILLKYFILAYPHLPHIPLKVIQLTRLAPFIIVILNHYCAAVSTSLARSVMRGRSAIICSILRMDLATLTTWPSHRGRHFRSRISQCRRAY